MNYAYLHPRDEIALTLSRIYRYKMTTTSGGNLSIIDPRLASGRRFRPTRGTVVSKAARRVRARPIGLMGQMGPSRIPLLTMLKIRVHPLIRLAMGGGIGYKRTPFSRTVPL
jgi:hypothetical protein